MIRYILTKNLQKFLQRENISSRILIILSIVSLVISNTLWGYVYIDFWNFHIPYLEQIHIPHTIVLVINDMLMPLFFFIVGAEIRYEITKGSLNSIKKAALPFISAIGGIIMPAIIYMLFNKGKHSDTIAGWGIPTATDIAFSVSVLSLLKNRITKQVKVFLLALAIFDDLGAIIIIALFYGGQINFTFFFIATGIIVLLYFIEKKQNSLPDFIWVLLIIILWYFLHLSGIHGTIAGVVAAFLLPEKKVHHSINKLMSYSEFIVLPLFVLANTTITLTHSLNILPWQIILGIMLGLILGKPLGIYLITRTGHKLGIIEFPKGIHMHDIIGIGIIAGIGFTMSIFVANLSFPTNPIYLSSAKLSVILASLCSAIFGLTWFWQVKKHLKK